MMEISNTFLGILSQRNASGKRF